MFRMHTKELRYWALNAYYGGFILLVRFSSGREYSPFVSAVEFPHIEWFSFIKHYVDLPLCWLYVAMLYYMFLLLFFWRFRGGNILNKIKSKQHIPEEILFWICIIGAIPGNMFEILGGSAVYFSYVQELGAVLLLVSFDVPDEVMQALKKTKCIWIRILAGCVAACFGFFIFYNGGKCVKGYVEFLSSRYQKCNNVEFGFNY